MTTILDTLTITVRTVRKPNVADTVYERLTALTGRDAILVEGLKTPEHANTLYQALLYRLKQDKATQRLRSQQHPEGRLFWLEAAAA